MARSDIIWNFFSNFLQPFIALLQSSLQGEIGFWVLLQGGAKTEHKKGSIEEEQSAFTRGASWLATTMASSCV